MKFYSQIIIGCLLLLPFMAASQIANYSWHFQSNGDGQDDITENVIMSNSDIVTYGTFSNVVDFDPSPVSHLLNAQHGFNFISRLTADGKLMWAVNFDSTANLNVYSIARDQADNIYIGGTFYGLADFDPSTDTVIIRTPNPTGSRPFIAKYNGSNGQLIYVKQFEFGYTNMRVKVATDALNNLIVVSDFSNIADVDPSPAVFNLTGGSSHNTFIAKFDNTGNFLNAVSINGDYQSGVVRTDAANNIYVVGRFINTVDFDPGAGTFNLTSATTANTYLLKLHSDLQFAKAISFEGTSSMNWIYMEINQQQQIVIGGQLINGHIDFDGSAATAIFTATCEALYFTLQDTSLNYISGFMASADNNNAHLFVNSICSDINSNVYLLGTLTGGGINLDPANSSQHITSSNGNTVFAAKYNSTGTYLWADTLVAVNASSINPSTILTGRNNRLYISGNFDYSVDLAFGPSVMNLYRTYTGSHNFDAFVAAYDQCTQDSNTVNTSICDGQFFYFHPDTLRNSGTFIQRYFSSTHCDSIVTLHLTIDPINTNVCSKDDTLMNLETGASFQWINCDSNTPAPGAVFPYFIPDNSGYSVVVTKNGCSDTSECIQLYDRGNAGIPEFSWGNNLTYIGYSAGSKVRIDSKDNFVVSGNSGNTIDLDLLGLGLHSSHVYHGGYAVVAKYDGNKNYLSSFIIGAPDYYNGSQPGTAVWDMILDDEDNIYLLASYSLTTDIDPGPGEVILNTGLYNNNFLAKYSPDGQLIWYKILNYDYTYCLFHDHLGNIFVGGQSGGSPAYQLKVEQFDKNGNFVWTFNPPPNGNDLRVNAGTCDNNNNIYFAGTFQGTIDFDPGAGVSNMTSAGSSLFVAKYNVNHQLVSANQYPNYSYNTTSMVSDCDTNVYICAGYDSYSILMKYQVGYLPVSDVVPVSVSTDNKNNLYYLYSFENTAIVGSDTLVPVGAGDIGFSKFDMNGNYEWTARLGTIADDFGYSIAADRKNNVYIMGTYNDSIIDVDAGPGVFNLYSNTFTKSFLLKYGQSCAPVDTAINGDSAYISANNTLSYYQWIDCNTGLVVPGANGATIPETPSGYYKVIIYQGDCVDTSGCHYVVSTLGINSPVLTGLKLYPNPNNRSELYIQSSSDIDHIEIYSSDGSMVFEKSGNVFNSFTLDISEFQSGVYYVVLKSKNGAVNRGKFVRVE